MAWTRNSQGFSPKKKPVRKKTKKRLATKRAMLEARAAKKTAKRK